MKILIVDDEKMALEVSRETVLEIQPSAEIICTSRCSDAIIATMVNNVDIALLDIEMPGMSGLQLAKRLKELNQDINIIFVTAYSKYAVNAFAQYASGYLLKPLQKKDLEAAFEHLRNPIRRQTDKLRVQCFGNFEAFYKNRPVVFQRAKAKEIFAYLVSLNGASANTGELCAVLWEDSMELERNKHYLRNLLSDLRKALRSCNAEEAFIIRRNQYSVNPDKIECDYYNFLKKDPDAVNSYRGEFMKQYSWAEFIINY